MELIDLGVVTSLETSPSSTDELLVAHRDARPAAVLGPGDEVVLRESDGEYRAGQVVRLETRGDELVYVVRRGVRLPPGLARERLEGAVRPAGERGPYSTQSVVDLLGQLRRTDPPRPEPGDPDGT